MEKKTGTFMQTEESRVTTETCDTTTRPGELAELREEHGTDSSSEPPEESAP